MSMASGGAGEEAAALRHLTAKLTDGQGILLVKKGADVQQVKMDPKAAATHLSLMDVPHLALQTVHKALSGDNSVVDEQTRSIVAQGNRLREKVATLGHAAQGLKVVSERGMEVLEELGSGRSQYALEANGFFYVRAIADAQSVQYYKLPGLPDSTCFAPIQTIYKVAYLSEEQRKWVQEQRDKEKAQCHNDEDDEDLLPSLQIDDRVDPGEVEESEMRGASDGELSGHDKPRARASSSSSGASSVLVDIKQSRKRKGSSVSKSPSPMRLRARRLASRGGHKASEAAPVDPDSDEPAKSTQQTSKTDEKPSQAAEDRPDTTDDSSKARRVKKIPRKGRGKDGSETRDMPRAQASDKDPCKDHSRDRKPPTSRERGHKGLSESRSRSRERDAGRRDRPGDWSDARTWQRSSGHRYNEEQGYGMLEGMVPGFGSGLGYGQMGFAMGRGMGPAMGSGMGPAMGLPMGPAMGPGLAWGRGSGPYMSGRGVGGTRPPIHCGYCDKSGHWEADCSVKRADLEATRIGEQAQARLASKRRR